MRVDTVSRVDTIRTRPDTLIHVDTVVRVDTLPPVPPDTIVVVRVDTVLSKPDTIIVRVPVTPAVGPAAHVCLTLFRNDTLFLLNPQEPFCDAAHTTLPNLVLPARTRR